jgi:CubicO group peptidase (beta-lactamase class C family)
MLLTNFSIGQSVQQFKQSGNIDKLGFDTKRIQRIDSLLNGYIQTGNLPNALALIIKDGNVVYNKAYGYKDVERKQAVQLNDIFRSASQTKAITTVVLLSLYEENKFMLDDPIEKYLPMFANPQVYESGNPADNTLKTRPTKSSITIRHLLTHTSGYNYEPYGQLVEGFSYRQPVSTKEVLERMAKIPLQHDPGERFTYGFSTDIAGYLAEVISGKTLDILMRERVFEPLGMNDTYFVLPKEKHDRLVTMYHKETSNGKYKLSEDTFVHNFPKINYQTAFCGGGGLSGTIEDYAKFCQMVLNGGIFNNRRILSSKTIELMTTNQMDNVISYHPFSLGFELTDKNRYNRTMVPVNSLKWGGAFGTDYILDRENHMILLLYSNIQQPYEENLKTHERFHVAVYQSMK